ncbi:MAG: TIGR03619 family F420-dependent LLM class oxidoreductase [Myxococcota bacterium]|nr:TIGR03619 family F420-dependent LLM class oxidoreductase [Myxococcota bacterium]
MSLGFGRVKFGVPVRVMGPQSEPGMLVECVRAAEAAGLDELWVADHVAIPPDDAEGSNGRYLDPLATLAFLAGQTQRIRLGTGVLILPYRPKLPTAKAIATVQELSGERLSLGVGLGWMEPEFRALGVSRKRRGEIADETLEFLHRCFEDDEVEENGQRFLFRPRPARPPILIGGAPPHALRRTLRYGDGWMPMAREVSQIAPAIARLRELAAEAGRECPRVLVFSGLPLDDPERARERAQGFAEAGVDQLICGFPYRNASEYARAVETIAAKLRPGLASASG